MAVSPATHLVSSARDGMGGTTRSHGVMVAVWALVAGCGGAGPGAEVPTRAGSESSLVDGVGRYESSPRTFRTNAFFIEGDDGVVLVDTMFTPSEAVRALEHAERETGKPVVLAVVLHANPDKFNGTQVLRARGVRVITSQQVRDLIPGVFALRSEWFGARYRPDWPTETPLPETFGGASTTLQVAGLELRLHVLGPAVSEAHVALEWNGHLFVGDLIANRHHGWLEIGKTDQWQARLAELAALAPQRVHPGRGASGGPELITAMQAYLQSIVDAVAATRPRLPLDDSVIEGLRQSLQARYPGYGNAYFLRLGLPAEYRRQATLAASEPAAAHEAR